MNWFRNLWQTRRTPFMLLTTLAIIMFALPTFAGEYIIYAVIRILILALFAYSVNLLLGYTGLLSFGQVVFYGAGAYGFAKILALNPTLPFPVAILFGVAIAALFALILGYICVRHTAIYFTMLTLAFAMMCYSGIRRIDWFGEPVKAGAGYMGIHGIPRAPFEIAGFTISMESLSSFYYFFIVVVGIAIFVFYRLVNSPLGLSFQAVRDSESRVAFTGISVRNTRLLSFVIAGAYAGLAGAMFVALDGSAAPYLFYWTTSTTPIIAALLGGMYTFPGPLVGAVVLYWIKDIVLRFPELAMHWMIFIGGITIALVLALPGGLVGTIEGWLARRRMKPSVAGGSNE